MRSTLGFLRKILKQYKRREYTSISSADTLVVCNICLWKGHKFEDFDVGYGGVYENSLCPRCHSQPRHRSLYFYLQNILPNQKPINFLHVSPEKCLDKLISSYKNINYLSIDLDSNNAMKAEDLTKLTFKDNSFDFILCSHVLEHIKNDKKAISEIYRVLNRNGKAVIDVPINYTALDTYEDDNIKSKKERTKAYLQWDHERLYGIDFIDLLNDAGFVVNIDTYILSLGSKKIKKHGLEYLPIFLCNK
tara:strand:+ start:11023 stop:11766 length:744 start_codon:yes stop_codon:yes gene_type:complete